MLASVLDQKFGVTSRRSDRCWLGAPTTRIRCDTRRRRNDASGDRSPGSDAEFLIQDTRRADDAYPLRFSEEALATPAAIGAREVTPNF
ncbi:hypothetical protein Pla86_12370 [Planctomycetes bacterium Pla86]|uniref:Uncharacterized protein n=1 Tax=Engelhardtia mirabilis TaxID=2528011 RepID=A0A518BGR6_9BACT|nr:hypothetical protein Pla133_12370 [Planctomycetes bacterium Pla133]QDV00498.1 hypothetical protein Pla86_12370 [Planctomycetes bacterium Pla86]